MGARESDADVIHDADVESDLLRNILVKQSATVRPEYIAAIQSAQDELTEARSSGDTLAVSRALSNARKARSGISFSAPPASAPAALTVPDPHPARAEPQAAVELPEAGAERFRIFPLVNFVDRPGPCWIIRDLLPDAELGTIFGPPGAGKSFVALDLAAAVQRGVPWRNLPTTKGNVLYVAAEGAGGLRNRLLAYESANKCDLSGMCVMSTAPNLLKDDQVQELAAVILMNEGGPFALIVIDTLAQAIPGADENSAKDMGVAIGACKALRRATGATILLVHHAGKDEHRGMRGSSALHAAADAAIQVSRSQGQRFITVAKQKDGVDGARYPFNLRSIVIDHTVASGEVSSCVVEHVEGARALRKGPTGRHERQMLATLREMQTEIDGEIRTSALLDRAAEAMATPDEGQRDRRREIARKALRGLVQGGHVEEQGNHCRLADECI